MSALEDEIIRRIRQLDEIQQRELLDKLEVFEEPEPDDWLERVRSLREELRAKYGDQHFGSVVDMVNEAREERLDDIMGSDDSSTLIATALNEPISQKADALIAKFKQDGTRIAAPALLRYEIVSVIRKAVYRNRLSTAEGQRIVSDLLSKRVLLMLNPTLLKRAYELATLHNLPSAYDAQYLAVAESLQCDFWTADERLFNTVSKTLSWVKWVGNA